MVIFLSAEVTLCTHTDWLTENRIYRRRGVTYTLNNIQFYSTCHIYHMYGCESLTPTKDGRNQIDAFEMWVENTMDNENTHNQQRRTATN